ncbi:unnamed protein product [Dovyalis caffra]|uniref:Uncharacterized protein n=1 Tax=Dovyalis caffra TaxID=77055 RepID=A0AAV1S3T1_9ROSI|nr:unnamed protein product [Dovyalis caffra]
MAILPQGTAVQMLVPIQCKYCRLFNIPGSIGASPDTDHVHEMTSNEDAEDLAEDQNRGSNLTPGNSVAEQFEGLEVVEGLTIA